MFDILDQCTKVAYPLSYFHNPIFYSFYHIMLKLLIAGFNTQKISKISAIAKEKTNE